MDFPFFKENKKLISTTLKQGKNKTNPDSDIYTRSFKSVANNGF